MPNMKLYSTLRKELSDASVIVLAMNRVRSRCFENKFRDYEGTLGNCDYLRDVVRRVLRLIVERSPSRTASRDGGLYVGPSGIGYSFYAVAESAEFSNIREECLQKALEYVKVIYR